MRKEVRIMSITLRAITAEGLGGEDFYTETVTIKNEGELERARIAFALKYNVQLDNVTVVKEA
jgi:hypothetical protein